MNQFKTIFPEETVFTDDGRIEIGGCDLKQVAGQFGTPAYVVSAGELRRRAVEYQQTFAQLMPGSEVAFASKACPATPILKIANQAGMGCDVASLGELELALHAGFQPARLHLHGNAKSAAELERAVELDLGHIVIDNRGEAEQLIEIAKRSGKRPNVLIRVTPGVRGKTHDGISTGQADSKFGFGMIEASEVLSWLATEGSLNLEGIHAHIGSQLLELEPYVEAVKTVAPLAKGFPVLNMGGGLGVAYSTDQVEPPPIHQYARAKIDAVKQYVGDRVRLIDEPGRSLVARAGVTLYSVDSVKQNVSRWVAVDGGMADNLRPMLYGAKYVAQIVDRMGGGTVCKLAGKHCESTDVLVKEADLNQPRVGDVVVVPTTGAYGYSMVNNYNGLPKPPMVFVENGVATEVIRRERIDELWSRDVASA